MSTAEMDSYNERAAEILRFNGHSVMTDIRLSVGRCLRICGSRQ